MKIPYQITTTTPSPNAKTKQREKTPAETTIGDAIKAELKKKHIPIDTTTQKNNLSLLG